MKIGLDVDDVMIDFVDGIIEFHNDRYGTDLDRKNFTSYHFNEVWGGTMEEAIKKIDEFVGSPYFKNLVPVLDAVETIQRLYSRNSFHVITSRSKKLEEITKKCLTENFGNKFVSINFSKNHYTGWGEKTKSEICAMLGIDYHIEDSLDYAKQIVAETPKTKVLLLNSPWNQTTERLNPKIQRVRNWDGIFNFLRNQQ